MRTNTLVTGDPLSPDPHDIIAQFDHLPVGEPLPDGWRVLSGNVHHSAIGRLVYRFECET